VTLADALAAAAACGLDRLDAQLLLLQALRRNTNRAWLLAHDRDELAQTDRATFLALCERRARGEPLAYIAGHKEFFGLDLLVDPRVLVPRPETELVMEWALEVLTHSGRGPGSTSATPGEGSIAAHVRNDGLGPKVIDLGTGSGAIALAIKRRCPSARVDAVDSSPAALEVARGNARRLSLDVNFVQSSWLAASSGDYDLIVGNPPYVADADPHLTALQWEPLSALASGPDGLSAIRTIIAQAPSHLRPGGWLILEHGWDQAQAVRNLLAAAGLSEIATRRDLAGIERCSSGQWLELG
jgi:release factor glutamine methyltransferase